MGTGLTVLFIWGVVVWAIPVTICNGLGHRRNRTGWPYGLLLGWLGVLILSCTSTLPSTAEMQVRELDAQYRLNEMRQIAAARES